MEDIKIEINAEGYTNRLPADCEEVIDCKSWEELEDKLKEHLKDKTFYVAARGEGKSMKTLRKAYEEAEQGKLLEGLERYQMTTLCGLIANDLSEQVKNRFEYLCQELEEVQNTPYIPDISSLKKQIKYSKNPMEKKRLEQELNQAYKKIKKK